MSAHWADNQRAGAAPPATKLSFALPSFGDLARLMTFYNTRQVIQPGARNGVSSNLSQLTKVALRDVQVRRVSSLNDFCLRVDASVNDPVYLLMRSDRDGAGIRASRGVQVEFAFSMGSAHVVGALPGIRDTQALGRTA
jgi:hypothetical protein